MRDEPTALCLERTPRSARGRRVMPATPNTRRWKATFEALLRSDEQRRELLWLRREERRDERVGWRR